MKGRRTKAPWIPVKTQIHHEREVILLAAATGLDEDQVVGTLIRVWSWAQFVSRNGHASGVTEALLDRVAQRDNFAAAMRSVGWLHVENDGVTFPNWEAWLSKGAKERASSARRQSRKRSHASVTEVSRINRDKSVTREEKRREEKRTEEKQRKISTPASRSPDHQRLVSVWDEAYAARYKTKPTWGAKQGAIVKRLLERHGFDLVSKRALALLTNPPAWVTGSVDIGFLESQFDKLAEAQPDPMAAYEAEQERLRVKAREDAAKAAAMRNGVTQ